MFGVRVDQCIWVSFQVPTLKEVAKDGIAFALNRKKKKDENTKETGAGGRPPQLLIKPPVASLTGRPKHKKCHDMGI